MADLNYYWKEFLLKEDIRFTISETRDVEYTIGSLKSVHNDNVYFIGSAAGFSDDFFGFGAIRAIKSGIFSARSIAEGLNYDKMINPLLTELSAMHQYREAYNTFENKDFDRFVAYLGLSKIKKFVHKNPLLKSR